MSNNYLPVEYDPVNFKLFAPRAISGIEEVVDLPEVETVTSGSVYTVSTTDQNKFIKIQSTAVLVTSYLLRQMAQQLRQLQAT